MRALLVRGVAVGVIAAASALAFADGALAAAPVSVNPPLVTGTFRDGQTLTATSGDWTSASAVSYAYQWQDCLAYSAVVAADGPNGYWRLGEATGTTAADSSGHGLAGSYSGVGLGAAGPLAGDPATGASFNGTSSFVDVPDAAGLKPASAFTLEAWVKTTATSGIVVAKPYTAGALQSYSLSIAAGKAVAKVDLSGGSFSATSTSAVNDGGWHLLDASFDGSSLRMYVDGALQTTTATSGSLQYSTLDLQLGRFDTSGQYFAGSLEEVALYPASLSVVQAQAHQAAATSATGVSCTPIFTATSDTYTLASSDVGKRVGVAVTATNADGSTWASSAATLVGSASPVNVQLPQISGTTAAGQTVSVSSGDWSGTTPMSYSYQWQYSAADNYRMTVLNDHPLDYWRLGETAGVSAAADEVGTRTGTYSAGAVPTAGALAADQNSAGSFNGQTYVGLPSVQFDSGDFTIEGWFSSTSAGSRPIWISGSDGSSSTILLLYGGQTIQATAVDTAGHAVSIQPSQTYNDGKWHHAVFVRSGSTFSVYVDGVLIGSSTVSIGDVDVAGAPARIGGNGAGTNFVGSLDEVAVYNTALSQAQIQAHDSGAVHPVTTNITGATSANYTIASADRGYHLQVAVTATNSAGTGTATSAAVLVQAAGPVNLGLPSISGSTQQGNTLTASPGAWSGTQPISYGYQWYRAGTYRSVVMGDHPLGYWRLGETSGSTAVDELGARPGAFSSGAAAPDAGGLVGDANGSQYFTGSTWVGLPTVQFDAGDFTVEGWFKSTASNETGFMWRSGVGGNGRPDLELMAGSTVSATALDASSTASMTAPGTYSDGKWHYAAFVRSGSTFTLYVDGAVAGTRTVALGDVDAAGAGAYIGDYPGQGFFQGSLDEIAVYASALSATQIQSHFNAGLGNIPISGATAQTYTTTASDLGATLRVAVTASNSAGSNTASSPATGIVTSPSGPTDTSPPVASGAAVQGSTLAATTGSWAGAAPITYSYQWQRATSYRSTVMADHPLGYWRLGDSAGATSAADEAGTRTGTYASAAVPTGGALAGDQNSAGSFNGQTYVSLPSVQFDSGDFTIEGWFNSTSSGSRPIWVSGSDGSTSTILLLYGGQTIQATAVDTSGRAVSIQPSQTYNDGKWHHVGFVRSGSTFKVYVDGVLIGSSTATIGDVDGAGTPARIGGNGSGSNFVGAIDEVAVYNTALSQAQIQADDNAALHPVATNISGATAANYTLSGADAGNEVGVQVTATNSLGSTAASSTLRLIAPPGPALATPNEGDGIGTLTPVLAVQPLSGVTRASYQFQVATDSSFTNVLASSGWLPSTTTWTVPTSAKLADGNTYFWRAQAMFDATQQTGWTTARSFRVFVKQLGTEPYWAMWSSGPLAVNEATGNLVLALPGPSFPTASGSMGVSLTYNALDTVNHGLGAGWTLAGGDLNGSPPTQLVDHNAPGAAWQADIAEVVWPDGGSGYYSHVGQSGTYLPPPGDSSQLTKNADGTWTLVDSDGTIYSFGAADGTSGVAVLTSEEIADAGPGKSKETFSFTGTSTPKLSQLTDQADTTRTVSLNWSCSGALVCITGPDNVTWRYVGDASGRLQSISDGTRTITQLSYDSNSRVNVLKNADDLDPTHASAGYNAAHQIAFAYDGQGRVTSINESGISDQSPGNSQWSFAYNPGAVSTTPTRAAHAGIAAGTARTAAGYTLVTPPNQQGQPSPKQVKVFYDTLDHPIETDDTLGRISEAAYNSRDEQLWSEDPDGNPTDNSWDTVNDVLLSTTGPDPGNGLGRPTSSYRYDEAAIGTAAAPGPPLQGLAASYYTNTVLAGRATTRRTDSTVDFDWGTLGPDALPAGTSSYSVRWTSDLSVPSEGDYTLAVYADNGVRLTIDGIQALNSWQAQATSLHSSQPIHLTAGQHKLELDYWTNAASHIHLRWSCAGCPTPIADQVIPTADLLPAWNNQTSVVSPSGRIGFSHYADPAAGHPDYTLNVVGGQNLITSFSYDSYGRLTSKVMPKGNASRTIDATGNLQGGANSTYETDYSYYTAGATATPPVTCGGASADQAGGLKNTSPHGVAATSLVYDSAGRTVARTNGAGTSCFHYDGEGRLTSEQAPGDAQATTFSYDPSGQQLSASDASGTVSTSYDEAGRPKSTTDSWGAVATMSYDGDGNLLTQTETPIVGGASYITSYSYDAADQLTGESDPCGCGRSYQFFYDNRGNLKATQYPNGTFSWIDRNPLGETTNVYTRHGTLGSTLPSSVPADASPIADFAYTYSADGQKTQEIRSGGGLPTQTTNYSYDALGRLSHVDLPSGVGRDYGYDLDSNRASISENGATVASYSYDPATTAGVDQLTSITSGGTTTSYAYTSDGQVKTRGADTLNWDGWGRLSGGSFNGTSVSYGFDATGGWRSRTTTAKTTRYLLGDDFETNASGTLTTSYTGGPAGDLAQYSGAPSTTGVSYLYYDDHGNQVAEADNIGARTAAHSYDPFGGPLDAQPANSTVHRFTGRWDKQYDTSSGLIQMGARPYDPTIGRFYAIDPVDGGSLNNYDYAGQDPIDAYDLDGRSCWLPVWFRVCGDAGVKSLVHYAEAHPVTTILALATIAAPEADAGKAAVAAIRVLARTDKGFSTLQKIADSPAGAKIGRAMSKWAETPAGKATIGPRAPGNTGFVRVGMGRKEGSGLIFRVGRGTRKADFH